MVVIFMSKVPVMSGIIWESSTHDNNKSYPLSRGDFAPVASPIPVMVMESCSSGGIAWRFVRNLVKRGCDGSVRNEMGGSRD